MVYFIFIFMMHVLYDALISLRGNVRFVA